MSVLPYFRLSKARANEILAQVEQGVASWQEEGRALGMTRADLDSFAEAFEHEERAAARAVLA
jgi:serine/threonine-protein kinase HipA